MSFAIRNFGYFSQFKPRRENIFVFLYVSLYVLKSFNLYKLVRFKSLLKLAKMMCFLQIALFKFNTV